MLARPHFFAVHPRSAAQIMADECLCFRARRVSRVLTRLYDDALRPLGLPATQLTVLNAVAMMSGTDGAAMRELADVLAMDPTTLSRTLRPLQRADLLRVSRLDADRRVRVVHLTPKGERLIEAALPLWTQAHERIVAALGPDAAAELRDHFDATIAVAPASTHASS